MRTLLLLFFSALAGAQTVRVMSFNVRYPNPSDGQNYWDNRRDLLVDTVRKHNPDVMGTQELFKNQGDYIVEKLPAYAWFGTSRRGNEQDEYMGVFYRKDRLRLKEQGQFWLSETPDTPGSQSWNMSLPRMVTWGLFELADGRTFYLLNTHFAHRREDEEARVKSAAVIASRIAQLPPGVPKIVTGDFNAPAGGEVYRAMLSAGLVDTRSPSAHSGPEGTFHGFSGKPGETRIDWILTTPGWKVRKNLTITDNADGRYPSDHFPVIVEMEYPAQSR
jgi:endonuclease/exonuclease/phosphatase family metal-dependent hydrolase